jgi:hypothetical protein
MRFKSEEDGIVQHSPAPTGGPGDEGIALFAEVRGGEDRPRSTSQAGIAVA